MCFSPQLTLWNVWMIWLAVTKKSAWIRQSYGRFQSKWLMFWQSYKQLKTVLYNGTYQTTWIIRSATSQTYNYNWAGISFPIASNIFFSVVHWHKPNSFWDFNRRENKSTPIYVVIWDFTYTLHFLGISPNYRSYHEFPFFFLVCKKLNTWSSIHKDNLASHSHEAQCLNAFVVPDLKL